MLLKYGDGNAGLLHDAFCIKETFCRYSFSQYDFCNTGGLRLIPDAQLLEPLRQDYQAMLTAPMFYGDTLLFEVIVEWLRDLEKTINDFVGSKDSDNL